MPYAVPAPRPSSPSPSPSPSPSSPHHRRTRSSFSDEQGPGAFVSLGALPRRRPSATKKAVFHLNADDSPPEDHSDNDRRTDHAPQPAANFRFTLAGYPHVNSLKLATDSGRFSIKTPSHIQLPPAVPFPSASPLASPTRLPSTLRDSPGSPSSLPRTPSTPVILSNGKHLKSSLKSSSSSPNIAGDMLRTKHLRAQSAPSTPNMHKNVHFDDNGLESVCVFNRSGKPISVSKPTGDDTETETEADTNSTAERGMSSFPFPSLSSSSLGLGLSMPSSSQNVVHEIDLSPHTTSAIPAPSPPPAAHVHLETVTLPRTRPPTLRGTVLVRNVSYEKLVAVRFTLDEWQTTSEVVCKHVVSLPGLPPPFPTHQPKRDEGDVAGRIVTGPPVEDEPVPTWDRFSFTIRLEDYESKLADRTLWLVARFTCPGGEWWDNNEHHNYRVGFRRAASASLSPLATPVPSAFTVRGSNGRDEGNARVVIPSLPHHLLPTTSQQRSFSAPNTLRYTPMTGTLAGIPVVSSSPLNKSALAPPMLVRTMSYPPSPAQPMDQTLPHTNSLQHLPRPASPTTRETAARTSSYISRRLSLSNYVAPGSSPTEKDRKVVVESSRKEEMRGLVTPPITPPGTVRVKGMGLPGSPPRIRSPPPSLQIIAPDDDDNDSEDNAEELGDIPSEPEDDDTSLHLDTSSLLSSSPPSARSPSGSGESSPNESLLPFSPTSLNASARPFLPFNQGGYLSPPRSRDASEDGSGEGGRGSPATGTPPSEPAADYQPSSSSKPMHVVLPALGLNFSHQRTPAAEGDAASSSLNTIVTGANGARVDTSDSSYAAFVRQWCFAQSGPPTPGVHSSSSPSASPRNTSAGVSSSPPPSSGVSLSGGSVSLEGSVERRSGSSSGAQMHPAWLGMDPSGNGNGYGFPGFNFGAVAGSDVGMVGAHMG